MTADGVINVNKQTGWTSHDVVAKLRGLLKIKKVGHMGTLDPMATGVLPVCLGKGTKVIPFLMDAEKEYDAVLCLGQETDTQDATGKVIRSCNVPLKDADRLYLEGGVRSISQTLRSFVGTYRQTPPMYSAVKVKGTPLYKTARAGKVVVRRPREVFIREIRLHKIEGSDIFFSVVCSKGTYIRTLCSDIGAKLGVGGHLRSLRRTRSGNFHLCNAIEIEPLCELYMKGGWEKEVTPLNEVLKDLPALWVKERYLDRLRHGVQIGKQGIAEWEPFERGASLRFLDCQGELLALGKALLNSDAVELRGERPENVFKIKKVLSDIESPAERWLYEQESKNGSKYQHMV
ncbi:MAG: tRNA pseudouridine(55) synthase TruB [Nitrospiria bacterium]